MKRPFRLPVLDNCIPSVKNAIVHPQQYSQSEYHRSSKHHEASHAEIMGMLKTKILHQESYRANWDQPMRTITKPKLNKHTRPRLRITVAKEQREIQEIARQNALAAMERLAEISQTSYNEAAAIAAAVAVLDRAYGKVNQTHINANLDLNGKNADVSGKELTARVEKTLSRINELTGGAAKPRTRKKPSIDLRKLDRNPDSSSLH